jgi:hypothetical protein
MLPLAHRWNVRCARCGHRGEISAAVADLAHKALRCAACGHRQAFAPETIVRSTRQGNGWRARARPGRTSTPNSGKSYSDVLDDRLDDLWAAN